MTGHATVSLGVNVIGVLSTGSGFGSAGRLTIRTLDARSIPTAAVDLALSGHNAAEPLPESVNRRASLGDLPFDVSVFQLNPDAFEAMVLPWMRRTGLDLAPTVNVIVPFWELPALPADWIPVLQMFDVVLAPTAFVRNAITASMPEAPRPIILDYPQAVLPQEGVAANRPRWFGAASGGTVFLSTFDIRADIERKNPWAAIEAFQLAFGNREDVALAIKVSNADTSRHAAQFSRLSEMAAADARIILMTEHLSREDLASLFASADVYVSLHRAEGLGFGMMEAMSVGTPVVATGWSGNVDFMDASNSLLVPFELVSVHGVSHPLYASESHQKWAEPDISAAAEALRTLADDEDLRSRLGEAAKRSMLQRWERQSDPGVFDELLSLAASGLASTPEHAARIAAAQSYMRSRLYVSSNMIASAKRAAVRVLRRVGLKPPAPADEYQWGPPEILS